MTCQCWFSVLDSRTILKFNRGLPFSISKPIFLPVFSQALACCLSCLIAHKRMFQFPLWITTHWLLQPWKRSGAAPSQFASKLCCWFEVRGGRTWARSAEVDHLSSSCFSSSCTLHSALHPEGFALTAAQTLQYVREECALSALCIQMSWIEMDTQHLGVQLKRQPQTRAWKEQCELCFLQRDWQICLDELG